MRSAAVSSSSSVTIALGFFAAAAMGVGTGAAAAAGAAAGTGAASPKALPTPFRMFSSAALSRATFNTARTRSLQKSYKSSESAGKATGRSILHLTPAHTRHERKENEREQQGDACAHEARVEGKTKENNRVTPAHKRHERQKR